MFQGGECLSLGHLLRTWPPAISVKGTDLCMYLLCDPVRTGCIKKRNPGISQEIDIVLRTKDFRCLGIQNSTTVKITAHASA